VDAYGNGERQFEALGDGARRALLMKLRRGPMPVGTLTAALAPEFRISRPAVSQHLRVLKEAGLVRDEAVGTRRFYRIDPAGLAAMREYLDGFWNEALQAFQAKIEEE
jgi:DNA-binding transcriptional ArsR family regulator